MVEEKEPKGITRRQFLKGITALGASALLSSCGVKEEPVSQKPTETLSPTATIPPPKAPTQESSPTPEPTSTLEVVSIPGIILTADYLKNAFAGIGGEERLNMMTFGQGYVSDSWGKSSAFSALSKEPIDSLKYLVSLGSFRGEEGIFSLGKQQEEVVFPQLEKLFLARMELNRVASEVDQKNQEFSQWTFPQGLLIRPGTQMTVVGLLDRSETSEEVTVDKESADNGQLGYALVAFTDYLRASQAGVPRHYLAIIPTHFPADPENRNTLSLQNLLEANGYQYDSQRKEITFADQDNNGQGQKTVLELNRIEGEELIKGLRQAVGLAFVDQIDGELIKNPVVPYPDEMPQTWTVKQEPDGGLILQAQNQEGNFDDFAKAVYDQETGEWGWEEITLSETVSYGVVYNIFDFPGWERGRDAFFDSATGALVIINDISRHHTVANEAVSFSLQGDFEAQFAARAHSIDDPSQRQEAQILFYSGYPELPSSHGVEIRFIEEDNLIAVNVINGVEKTAKFIVTPWDEVMAPESGALRVRFEDIVAGGNGRIIIYNDQGDELVARDLPFPVFAEQPRLYVKFAAVNATEDPQGVQMEVDYFRLLAPQGTNNVVKR